MNRRELQKFHGWLPMILSQVLLSSKENMNMLSPRRVVSMVEETSQITLIPFSISNRLTNFLIARRPTRALAGVDSFDWSIIRVVFSLSVRDKLFQREASDSSMVDMKVFGITYVRGFMTDKILRRYLERLG